MPRIGRAVAAWYRDVNGSRLESCRKGLRGLGTAKQGTCYFLTHREIVDDLEAALEQFRLIAEDLGEES
jgi:hypothetical protein